MRTASIYFFIAYLLHCSNGIAQSPNVSNEDEIRAVVIGYISNFFTNDYEKMEVHLHEKLSKRGINADGRLEENFTKSDLKQLMENKTALPINRQNNKVTAIKIDNHVATAILETGYPSTRWREYIHLAKLDNRWIVMDVFWSFNISP